mmetsp:Transcript_29364/g.44813  ORF Transcript_29364/g.44813 Transcript_29364/m.44813 type:complete len:82 (-) Transcript_29364:1365-1610(-)
MSYFCEDSSPIATLYVCFSEFHADLFFKQNCQFFCIRKTDYFTLPYSILKGNLPPSKLFSSDRRVRGHAVRRHISLGPGPH